MCVCVCADPGSGNVSAVGGGRGTYLTLNVPLLEGATDDQYYDVFTQ